MHGTNIKNYLYLFTPEGVNRTDIRKVLFSLWKTVTID